jgi:hypothetical protein
LGKPGEFPGQEMTTAVVQVNNGRRGEAKFFQKSGEITGSSLQFIAHRFRRARHDLSRGRVVSRLNFRVLRRRLGQGPRRHRRSRRQSFVRIRRTAVRQQLLVRVRLDRREPPGAVVISHKLLGIQARSVIGVKGRNRELITAVAATIEVAIEPFVATAEMGAGAISPATSTPTAAYHAAATASAAVRRTAGWGSTGGSLTGRRGT